MFLSEDLSLSKTKLFLLRLGEKKKEKNNKEELPKEEAGFSDWIQIYPKAHLYQRADV